MADKKKMLPSVVTGTAKDEIDLEDGSRLEYKLKLVDSNEANITSYKAVDRDTKAILFVYVTNIERTQFPDPDDWLTYRFADTNWLEKDSDGNLKFPQDKEKRLQERINQMNGDFIKRYGKEIFGKNKGEKHKPGEGLKDTDMEYRIEINDTPSVPGSPGIRIDIYQVGGDGSRKPIIEDRVKINLVYNKKIQVNLEEDGLVTYSIPSKGSNKWPWWKIGLVSLAGLAALAIILGIVFRRQIREWWKRRKNKKESQLEIF